MELQKQSNNATADREIVITRLLNAPQQLVYEAWTNPKHIIQWWGPSGFTNTFHTIELKPGGVWHFTMHGPDGTDYPNRIVFKDVVAPSLLSYTHNSGVDGDPYQFDVIVTFEQQGNATMLTMRSVFASTEAKDLVVEEHGAIDGANQTIDRLSQHLCDMDSNGKVLVIQRPLNAPLALVYKALTEADGLTKWWGPKGFEITSSVIDLRPGGRFHYCMSGNGYEMWGLLVYHDIAAPNRIEFVTSFSDIEGNICRSPFSPLWPLEVYNVLTLALHGSNTLLTLRCAAHNTTEEETKTFISGRPFLQQGFAGTFAQLDEYLATL